MNSLLCGVTVTRAWVLRLPPHYLLSQMWNLLPCLVVTALPRFSEQAKRLMCLLSRGKLLGVDGQPAGSHAHTAGE